MKPKVIFDNIIFYLQRSGGGTIYWLELIKRAKNDSSLISIFSEPTSKKANLFRKHIPLSISFWEKLPLWILRVTSYTNIIREKAIFHSSYYRISRSSKAINIVTIHDFTSELFFSGIRKFIHQRRKKLAIAKADGIICISNNTKKDLLKFYPTVDESKIRVIYNGVSEEYYPLPSDFNKDAFEYKHILDEDYIIYVGHRTKYKNFKLSVESVSLLPSQFKFLIIGTELTKDETMLLSKFLNNRYYCLSRIDNKTLNIFYNFSHCLLYPSCYEGFGIPLVEAMRAGCPVITTDRSSIPEVAGDAAILIHELEPRFFADAITKLSDITFRKNIIGKGFLQASAFSWDRCYSEVKKFYLDLFSSK